MARCLNIFCSRVPSEQTKWWIDYGTCSIECARFYYGPECVDD